MALIAHGLEVALPADNLYELHISKVTQIHFCKMALRELLMVDRRRSFNRILHIIHPNALPESVKFLCGLLGARSDRKC